MNSIFLSLLFLITAFMNAHCSDTVYVLFEHKKPNYAVQLHKHKNDPNANNSYPFGGGRHYHVPKKSGNFIKDISFNFWSYTPNWMDQQFEYEIVDESILHEKDFKDRDWFYKTDYIDFLKIFDEANVVYLIDENYIKNGKAYMVRVYFNYTAEE